MRLFLNCTGTQPDSATNEFQRADSSPFDPATGTYGDGKIQSDDIVQTRRYANMSDAGRPAAGPTAPIAPRCGSQPPPVANGQQNEPMAETLVAAPEGGIVRQLRVQSVISSSPAQVTVNILADAVGDEAEYGFTINYTPSILTNPVVSNGTAGAGAVSCNTTTSPGRIFCSVGSFPLPSTVGDPNVGEIAAGIGRVLIRVTFTVPMGIAPQMTAVTLTDVNASRDTLPLGLTIGSQNGTVTITGPTAASVSISGRVLTAGRRGIGNARVTLTEFLGQQSNCRDDLVRILQLCGSGGGRNLCDRRGGAALRIQSADTDYIGQRKYQRPGFYGATVKLENEDANSHAPILFYSVSARVNKAGHFIDSFRRKRFLNVALANGSATLPNE